jgi:hypothetical protein
MEKPFDLKDLEARLKAAGLPEVEGCARAVVESVFGWAEDSIKATPSRIDDLALGVLSPLKSWVLSKVDAIDGVPAVGVDPMPHADSGVV